MQNRSMAKPRIVPNEAVSSIDRLAAKSTQVESRLLRTAGGLSVPDEIAHERADLDTHRR